MKHIDLQVRPANIQLHVDIEKAMDNHKGKLFHFELRYSGGNIVDFVVRTYKTYEQFTQLPEQE